MLWGGRAWSATLNTTGLGPSSRTIEPGYAPLPLARGTERKKEKHRQATELACTQSQDAARLP
jgi:hypothetical protein